MLVRLYQVREVVWNLVKRELKGKYKGSVLGFFWSVGKPLLIMLILYGVFSTVIRIPGMLRAPLPYALHLLAGILPWYFLLGSLSEGTFCIIGNAEIIRKAKVDAEVFPTATIVSNMVHFALALLILFGFMAAFGVYPGWEIVCLPLLVVLQGFFLFAVVLFLSSLNVFYRDVGSITEVVLHGWFYITPIIYPVDFVWRYLTAEGRTLWEGYYYLFMLNPMAPLCAAYRRVLYGPVLHPREVEDVILLLYLLYVVILSLVLFVIGKRVFHKLSERFADEV
jgi:lipopolysaccharide transport system permease protein